MTSERIQSISKHFGSTVALADVSLQINAGELFFLLGPSGCGKSTLLRLIAGLHEPSAGRLWFNDRDVTDLPTQQRNAVMCFQSYALWPHMSVAENIRFGLDVRKIPRDAQQQRINKVLELVQMQDLAARKPNQLSGGQQQRVALARALAVEPACLLLDEPLSNLDAKLRHDMRAEIRRICKTARITTIYVTHDQNEALSVADRIGVLKDGRLIQVGTPDELYHRPNSVFVADFIGQTNLLAGRVVGSDGTNLLLDTPIGPVSAAATSSKSDRVTLSIRPEQLRISRNGHQTPGPNRVVGKALQSTFLGESSEHLVQVGAGKLKVISAPPLLGQHETLALEFDPQDVVVLAE